MAGVLRWACRKSVGKTESCRGTRSLAGAVPWRTVRATSPDPLPPGSNATGPAVFDVSASPPIGRHISRAAPGVLDRRVRHRRRRPYAHRRSWNPNGTICNHMEDSRPLDVAGVELLVPGPKAHPQGPRNQRPTRPTRPTRQPESGVSEPVDEHRGSGHEFRTRRLLVRFRTSQNGRI